jgi:hypothetical protein
MILPYRLKLLPVARRRFKYIIIHDTTCQFEGLMPFMKDSPNFQTGKLRSMNFIMKNEYELNYHFIVEKIKDDYETIVGRPTFARCEFEGLPAQYDHSIHIAVMGNFDYENPGERLYQQLAYRSVIPMMRQFHISPDQVKLHNEVDKDSNCPGSYFRRDLLMSYVKSWKVTNY